MLAEPDNTRHAKVANKPTVVVSANKIYNSSYFSEFEHSSVEYNCILSLYFENMTSSLTNIISISDNCIG